jgi:hypothetical protein
MQFCEGKMVLEWTIPPHVAFGLINLDPLDHGANQPPSDTDRQRAEDRAFLERLPGLVAAILENSGTTPRARHQARCSLHALQERPSVYRRTQLVSLARLPRGAVPMPGYSKDCPDSGAEN